MGVIAIDRSPELDDIVMRGNQMPEIDDSLLDMSDEALEILSQAHTDYSPEPTMDRRGFLGYMLKGAVLATAARYGLNPPKLGAAEAAIQPSDKNLHKAVKKLNAVGRHEDAIKSYSGFVSGTSSNEFRREVGWAYFKQGLKLKEQGRVDEAYQNFDKAHEIDEFFNVLPNVEAMKYLGAKPPIDKLKGIDGKETVIKGYRKENTVIALYTLKNGKVYGFAEKDLVAKKTKFFWDDKNDGIFEQQSKNYTIDIDSYK